MTLAVNFIAPAGVAQNIACRSGNIYAVDASGLVKAVVPADFLDVVQAGCIALGQSQSRSNFSATTNPTTANDNTQDYGIGSLWFNKSTGVMYVAESVGTGAASWAAQAGSGYAGLPWVTGKFYGVPGGVTPVSFLTVASTLYAYPFFVPNSVTLAALQASVITGQTGGKVELGIYADTGAGYPGALVTGTDTGDLVATSPAVVGPTNLAVALTPGWYWAAVQAAATGTMPSVAGTTVAYTNELGKLVGADTAAHLLAVGSEAIMGLSKSAVTYVALPATFPASATTALNTGVPLASLGV